MSKTYDRLGPDLRVESDGPVRIVTMNRPEHLNAFSDPLHDAMVEVWGLIADDEDAAAVVLTGAGRAFSAGGDVPGFQASYDSLEVRRRGMRRAAQLATEMIRFHLPLVAAVNGPAVGLGCSVAVMCDIVLIADTAFMADPHVNVGLVAGDGGTVTWPLYMSMLKAKEYLLLGDRIPALEAERLGLANRVVPQAEVLDEAMKLAHRLAAQPRQAVQDTKRALNIHLQRAADAVLPFALAAEEGSFATDDVRKAIEKFQSKG
jgi:enoyl-CoA hydratase